MALSPTKTPSTVYGATNPHPPDVQLLLEEIIAGIDANSAAMVQGNQGNNRSRRPNVSQADKSEFNIIQVDTSKYQHVGGITDCDVIDLDAGGVVNIEDMPLGRKVIVSVRGNAGGTGVVFSGFDRNFSGLGSGNTATVAAGGFLMVANQGTNNNFSTIVLSEDDVTFSTETDPTPTKVVYFAGQSNAQRAYLYGAIPALAAAMRDTSWVSPAYDEIIRFADVAKGGSSEDEAAESSGAGYWWDRSLNGGSGGAGPELTNALSDMSSLAPTDIIWDIGETVTAGIDDASLTTAELITSISAIFAAFREAHSSVNIHVNMIGSRDDERFDEAGSAVRYAYLKVIASLSYVYQGIEKYDLERSYNDLHLSYPGFQAYGARLARHLVNVWDSRSTNIGPTMTSAVLSNGGKTCTVVFTTTDTMQPIFGTKGAGVSAGPHPFSLHVFSGLTPVGNTIALTGGEVTATTSTTVTVEVYSETDMTGAHILAVQGGMYDEAAKDYAADCKDVGHFGPSGFPLRCGLIETLST